MTVKTYIKRVSLRNFQSHRATDFEFGPGLNIIVGPSDQGKSAVIRAIRWVVFNEPRGTGFIRAGETRCQVRLELSNGVAVERIRDESGRINRYILEVPGQEVMVFERFNKEVPLEIRQALGMQKLVIDRDRSVEINLAGQLEAPFLLEESGSTRSKILGRIANLHIIDAAQRDTLRDVSQAQQEISRLENEIEALEAELQRYEDLKEEEVRLRDLERLLGRLTALEDEARRLEELRCRREEALSQLAEIHQLLAQLQRLDQVGEYSDLVGQRIQELREIETLRDQMSRSQEELDSCRATIDSTRGLDMTEEILERLRGLRQAGFELQTTRRLLADLERDRLEKLNQLKEYMIILDLLRGLALAEEKVHEISDLVTRWDRLKEIQTDWRRAISALNEARDKSALSDNRLQKLAQEYGDLLQEAGRCPTCLAEINRETVARIRQELL